MAETESEEGDDELTQEIPVQLQKWIGQEEEEEEEEEETQFEREFVKSSMEDLKAKRVDSSDEKEPKTKKAKAKDINNGGLKGDAMGGSDSELGFSVLHFYMNGEMNFLEKGSNL